MALLPGQVLHNGVSNFIFGTNLGQQVSPQTVYTNTTIQGYVKSGNFQIMRAAIPSGKPNSYIDQVVAVANACGCALLVTLDLYSLPSNLQTISYLGNRCMLYEFGNEPNGQVAGYLNGTQYYGYWSSQIPSLRNAAPKGAAFIGPTIAYRLHTVDGQFITDWLTLCKNFGGTMLPDGVSFHHYPCTGIANQTAGAALDTVFASDYTIVDTAVRGVLGYSLPICLTEWNVGGGTPPPSYCADPTFVTPWVHTALDTMVSSGYAMACQFEAGTGEGAGGLDLIHVTSPYTPGPDYQPIVDKNIQYLSASKSLLVLGHTKFNTKKNRLLLKSHAVFPTQKTRITTPLQSSFITQIPGLHQLRSCVRGVFTTLVKQINSYAHGSLGGVDGKAVFTGQDGIDKLKGIG